jgi:phosphoserine aminotransferase
MTAIVRPLTRPQNPFFSSGPCSKRPGWSLDNFKTAMLGRSHRSAAGKARLKLAIDRTRALLKLPDDYLVAIVPGSDTGAVEMALWSLLGARGVDILAWEAFGKDWVTDIVKQLKLDDVRVMEAPYGDLPDLTKVDFARDVVFTWNGTTSGVRMPNADWIAADRQGLTICDATSGIFAQSLDWAKLDVITYSWQKGLGGEAAHGMLILSPRAVERLESHTPKWPVPKIFQLTKGGRLNREIFEGATINTPSMLCVEDNLDELAWAESIGGLYALIARSNRNAQAVTDWVERTPWIAFLAGEAETRSSTSVCLRVVDAEISSRALEEQAAFAGKIVKLLEKEGVAYDIGAYRDAPPGLRLWCGATVETGDLQALLPWLDWAFATLRSEFAASTKAA